MRKIILVNLAFIGLVGIGMLYTADVIIRRHIQSSSSNPLVIGSAGPFGDMGKEIEDEKTFTFSDYVKKFGLKNDSGVGLGSNDAVFEAFVKAIALQESGGNYNDVNARTGATGKYQIMPENWPKWANQAGLPPNSRMTPENQERVARYKLREYYDSYGVQGASVAWYAGAANGERWVKGMPDAVGENGHYSWHKTHGRGEPSVASYVWSVVAKTRMYLEQG